MAHAEERFIEPWVSEAGWNAKDFKNIETPCYVVSEKHLEKNLKILAEVEKKTGAIVLAALKSFSMWSYFPLMKKYLSGTECSSVNEAKLAATHFGKETHVFSPSYTEQNIKEYIKYASHISFNSFSQWKKFKKTVLNTKKKISCGIRVNPEHQEGEFAMYDPAAPMSHFGVTIKNFEPKSLDGIEGLHFHTLCESSAEALQRTLEVFERKFGKYLGKMKWVNFGGGHHITREGYNIKLLYKIIADFKKRYPHLTVYLEPGEAVALNAGVLVATVVDAFNNEVDIAILDASAKCHMPDVLEVPYVPAILGAKRLSVYKAGDKNVHKISGSTCLTGDIIGYYSFPKKLRTGDKLVLLHTAIYTMVQNNTFNGVDLPSIAKMDKKGRIKVIKRFGYKDFENRLS